MNKGRGRFGVAVGLAKRYEAAPSEWVSRVEVQRGWTRTALDVRGSDAFDTHGRTRGSRAPSGNCGRAPRPASRRACPRGAAPLGAFVRVVANREALDVIGKQTPWKQPVPADGAPPGGDHPLPERELARHRHAGVVREVLREVLAGQPLEVRNLLRLHYLDGLTLPQIAVLLKIHRVNVWKRAKAALVDIREMTIARLASRLEVGSTEAESLFKQFGASLNVSIGTVLWEQAEEEHGGGVTAGR